MVGYSSAKNGQNIKNTYLKALEKNKKAATEGISSLKDRNRVHGDCIYLSSEGPPQSPWRLEHKRKATVIELEVEPWGYQSDDIEGEILERKGTGKALTFVYSLHSNLS